MRNCVLGCALGTHVTFASANGAHRAVVLGVEFVAYYGRDAFAAIGALQPLVLMIGSKIALAAKSGALAMDTEHGPWLRLILTFHKILNLLRPSRLLH